MAGRTLYTHEVLRFGVLVATAAFLTDWASKSWALDTLQHTTMPLGALVLRTVRNDALAFSAGSGHLSAEAVFILRLVALALVVLVSRRVAGHSRRYAAGYALLFAGGLGNTADLLFRDGTVVDFIGAGPFALPWSDDGSRFGVVFNAADIAIIIGLGLIAPQVQDFSKRAQQRIARWEERWLWRGA